MFLYVDFVGVDEFVLSNKLFGCLDLVDGFKFVKLMGDSSVVFMVFEVSVMIVNCVGNELKFGFGGDVSGLGVDLEVFDNVLGVGVIVGSE